MAFTEAGGESQYHKEASELGLPMAWDNLIHKCCPRCSDELVLFEHIRLYKCLCGFKISRARFDEIVYDIESGNSLDRHGGYGFGGYQDEPPF